ncbi:hypothetical protein SAY86_001205 [Trapa natans]|uniref:endo-polygalacturonase n=1 Tax=Trapa natans TaxID=22666 RepID=A0AAN7MQL5_TRANT|nr:hypothetical protein SAY86_001205 [Trapa natans]
MMMSSVGSDNRLNLWSTALFLIFSVLFGLIATSAATSPKQFNVDDYGAKGDGGDDSEAFVKAWDDFCSTQGSVLLVPMNRTYHLKPIKFSGPCKSELRLQIYGTIKASPHLSDYKEGERHWMMFENLNDFVVEGRGRINGNGRKWWQRSCKVNKSMPCKAAPTALTFYKCNNLRVTDMIIQNAQQMHLIFQKCKNVKALNLLVHAPENSPNTDGIHITDTENILIKNSVIRTGDDCISIVNGSKNVQATDIVCGPGHGISIGSLGSDNSAAYVSNVLVNRARISGTTNGVRIKTWQGGSGYAKNIVFQNIVMRNVSNPIIIDQNYCDQEEPCHQQASAVQVSNIVYKNIRGTSASEVAIKMDCSKSHPCSGIRMVDIGISRVSSAAGTAKSSIANVKFRENTNVFLN